MSVTTFAYLAAAVQALAFVVLWARGHRLFSWAFLFLAVALVVMTVGLLVGIGSLVTLAVFWLCIAAVPEHEEQP